MEISHSVTANGYTIHCGKFQIGAARKTEEGFLGQSIFGDDFESKTMKDLKTKFLELAESLEGMKAHLVSRPYYITVEDARKMCGISHGGCGVRIKELHDWHPYLKATKYGAAIVKMALEAEARWDWGQQARDWLAKNSSKLPKMKTLDWDASQQAKRPIYLD